MRLRHHLFGALVFALLIGGGWLTLFGTTHPCEKMRADVLALADSTGGEWGQAVRESIRDTEGYGIIQCIGLGLDIKLVGHEAIKVVTGSRPRSATLLRPSAQTPAQCRAVVHEGTPDVGGMLDPIIVARELRKRKGCFKSCYERGLKRNQNVAGGRITTCFSIGPKGNVTAARIDTDTVGDDDLSNCCVDCAKRARFPAPEGGRSVVVCMPYVFTSRCE